MYAGKINEGEVAIVFAPADPEDGTFDIRFEYHGAPDRPMTLTELGLARLITGIRAFIEDDERMKEMMVLGDELMSEASVQSAEAMGGHNVE